MFVRVAVRNLGGPREGYTSIWVHITRTHHTQHTDLDCGIEHENCLVHICVVCDGCACVGVRVPVDVHCMRQYQNSRPESVAILGATQAVLCTEQQILPGEPVRARARA